MIIDCIQDQDTFVLASQQPVTLAVEAQVMPNARIQNLRESPAALRAGRCVLVMPTR